MFPGRRPHGNSSYDPAFARTFAPNRGSLQGTRRIGGTQNAQRSSTAPNTTTIITPGEPHYFGARIDRAAARAISTLCRCRNPDSHGDAWALNLSFAGIDLNGRPVSWKDLSNRVLDHCRQATANREEEHEAFQYILAPFFYRSYMRHYHHLNGQIGAGVPVVLCDGAVDVRLHGDGHVRNNVTEGGLRTVVNRPGGYSGENPFGGTGSNWC